MTGVTESSNSTNRLIKTSKSEGSLSTYSTVLDDRVIDAAFLRSSRSSDPLQESKVRQDLQLHISIIYVCSNQDMTAKNGPIYPERLGFSISGGPPAGKVAWMVKRDMYYC